MSGLRKLLKSLQAWLYFAIAAIAIASFFGAMLIELPEENPDPEVGAGIYAALIGLCVAACALLKAATNPENPRLIEFLIAVGICASAYLWVASESQMHPAQPELPLSLLGVFGVAAALTMAVPLVAHFRGRSDDTGQSEE